MRKKLLENQCKNDFIWLYVWRKSNATYTEGELEKVVAYGEKAKQNIRKIK